MVFDVFSSGHLPSFDTFSQLHLVLFASVFDPEYGRGLDEPWSASQIQSRTFNNK